MQCRCLEDSHYGLSYSPFIECSPVRVDKLLGYAVEALGTVAGPVVPEPSHHLRKPGPRIDVSDNLVDNIGIVSPVAAFINFFFQAWFLPLGAFCFRGLIIIALAP